VGRLDCKNHFRERCTVFVLALQMCIGGRLSRMNVLDAHSMPSLQALALDIQKLLVAE